MCQSPVSRLSGYSSVIIVFSHHRKAEFTRCSVTFTFQTLTFTNFVTVKKVALPRRVTSNWTRNTLCFLIIYSWWFREYKNWMKVHTHTNKYVWDWLSWKCRTTVAHAGQMKMVTHAICDGSKLVKNMLAALRMTYNYMYIYRAQYRCIHIQIYSFISKKLNLKK